MRHIALLAAFLPLTACFTLGDRPTSKDVTTANLCLSRYARHEDWARSDLANCLHTGPQPEKHYAPGTTNPAVLVAVMDLHDGNPDLRECIAEKIKYRAVLLDDVIGLCGK